jgi:hypothetical protein
VHVHDAVVRCTLLGTQVATGGCSGDVRLACRVVDSRLQPPAARDAAAPFFSALAPCVATPCPACVASVSIAADGAVFAVSGTSLLQKHDSAAPTVACWRVSISVPPGSAGAEAKAEAVVLADAFRPARPRFPSGHLVLPAASENPKHMACTVPSGLAASPSGLFAVAAVRAHLPRIISVNAHVSPSSIELHWRRLRDVLGSSGVGGALRTIARRAVRARVATGAPVPAAAVWEASLLLAHGGMLALEAALCAGDAPAERQQVCGCSVLWYL